MRQVAGRIADWLTGPAWRAALIAAALAFLPLTSILGGAVVALVALHAGAGQGLAVAGGAALAVGAWIAVQGGSLLLALAYLAMLFGPVLGLAALLRRTESLTLCLQVAVLGAIGLLLGMFALMNDPIAFWRTIVEQWALLLEAGGAGLDTEHFVATVAAWMPGIFAVSVLLLVLTSLFVGRWLQAAKTEGLAFGPEFRALRLGYVIAGAAALIGVAALVSRSLLLGNMAVVLLCACLLQGLAVMHFVIAAKGLSVGWLVLIYLLLGLPTPLLPLATAALIGLGFVDNWIDVRKRVNAKWT